MNDKKYRIRNLLVLAGIVVVVVILLVAAATMPRSVNPTGGELATDAPTATSVSAEETADPASTAAPEATVAPAEAYLVVTVAGTMYEPIALYEEGRYTVKRGDYVNVIEVTEDSICMAESSCDNQDCVLQGVVSLDNKDERVLRNMVICLPNEVTLELYTQEELVSLLLSMVEETPDE
ncbi:MAG: NusG domain II-containing protein [Clostridia bacterium]|nr:NusG domain II-containing protein [Clostridia bacterium]